VRLRLLTAANGGRVRWNLLICVVLGSCSMIPGTQASLENEARGALESSLFDAESTKFKDLKAVNAVIGGKSIRIICGEFNGKNKMGAYVGFKRFVVAPEEGLRANDLDLGLDFRPVSAEDFADKEAQDNFEAVWPSCKN